MITDLEEQLDRAAEQAARALHDFRAAHFEYFWFVGHVDFNGNQVIKRLPELDREASRLHFLAIAANKSALDAEYAARQ